MPLRVSGKRDVPRGHTFVTMPMRRTDRIGITILSLLCGKCRREKIFEKPRDGQTVHKSFADGASYSADVGRKTYLVMITGVRCACVARDAEMLVPRKDQWRVNWYCFDLQYNLFSGGKEDAVVHGEYRSRKAYGKRVISCFFFIFFGFLTSFSPR